MIRWLTIAIVVSISATAAADEEREQQRARADELAREGNNLGRQGQLDAAVAKFKQAYQMFPRALYACNLGLAYVRKPDWPRAHYFLSLCRSRWDSDEGTTLQPWVNQRIDESVAALTAGAFGQVRARVTPADAKVQVSAFSSDELIDSDRVVWLPQGRHTLTASRDGYVTRIAPVDVERGKVEVVELELEQEAAAVETPPITPTMVERERSRGKLPWIVLGSGAAAVVAGGVVHALAIGTKGDAEDIPPGDAFDDKLGSFRTQRIVAIGLYSAGAAAIGVGVFLLLRSPGEPDETPPVGFVTDGRGGALVYEGRW